MMTRWLSHLETWCAAADIAVVAAARQQQGRARVASKTRHEFVSLSAF